jgi:heat shock protein HslJ
LKKKILIALLFAVLVTTWTGCSGDSVETEPEEPTEPTLVERVPVEPTASPEQLAGLTYTGLDNRHFTLENGVAEEEGVKIELLHEMTVYGDLDGVQGDEAAVLLREKYGQAKNRVWLAVVTIRAGEPVVFDATLVVEREQLRFMSISERWIHLETIEHGPEDADCCPSQAWTKKWAIVEGELQQVSAQPDGVLSIAMLGDYKWLLTHFEAAEAAPETPEIHILFKGPKMKGNSGCTIYFADVTEATPGEMEFGSIGLINKSCRPEIMEIESKYLVRLREVVRYGFWMGQLALVWESEDGFRTLLFVRRPWPEDLE